MQRMRHHRERQRPRERAQERLHELPAKKQQQRRRHDEHDDQRVLARPPAFAIYRRILWGLTHAREFHSAG